MKFKQILEGESFGHTFPEEPSWQKEQLEQCPTTEEYLAYIRNKQQGNKTVAGVV